MAEREDIRQLPRIVTVTIVLVCTSMAFWQWSEGAGERSAQARGTVTATEFVRRGSNANIAIITASFVDSDVEHVIQYDANNSDLRIGDHIPLRYNPDRPQSALPASEVALETSRHRSFAVFSGLIGLIAILAAIATRLEATARTTGTPASRGVIPVR